MMNFVIFTIICGSNQLSIYPNSIILSFKNIKSKFIDIIISHGIKSNDKKKIPIYINLVLCENLSCTV